MDPSEEQAARLRGFGPEGLLAIVVVLAGNFLIAPLSAVLALVWARLARVPWSDLGLARPRRWWLNVTVGIVFGAALKLVMKSVVMPLLGADPNNRAYSYLVGNEAALPGFALGVIVIAGFGEEILFRGFLFERLGRLLGRSMWTRGAIVMGTAVVFGLAHGPEQGTAGVQQAMITGLVFGAIFAVTRNLWPLIVAHAVFDLVAVAIIYADLERTVAGWFFPLAQP